MNTYLQRDIWHDFENYHIDENKYDDHVVAAMERFNPQRFYRLNNVFRLSHLGTKIVSIPSTSEMELPTGSIVHLMDNIAFPNQIQDTPRWESNIFLKNETFKKHIHHIKDFDLSSTIELKEKYIYRISGLPTALMHFKSEYGSEFRYINALEDLPARDQVLILINHNPLFRARLFGPLPYFRKIQMILTSILNTVSKCQIMGKQQYLFIPWGPEIYLRDKFLKTRKELTRSTIMKPNSYQYIFMMHLLNMCNEKATTSIFSKVPEEVLSKLNLVFEYNGKYVFIRLSDLKQIASKADISMKLNNHLNALAIAGTPEEVKEEKVVDTKQDTEQKSVISHAVKKPFFKEKPITDDDIPDLSAIESDVKLLELEDIPEFTDEDEDSLVEQKIKAVHDEIKEQATTTTKVTVDLPEVSLHDEVIHGATPNAPTKINATKIDASITNIDSIAFDLMEANDQETKRLIDSTDLSPKAKLRLRKIASKFKTLTLDGETLEDILLHNNDLGLETDDLSPDIVGDLPDPSAFKSSLSKFDETYMKKTFHKHLVGVLTSFQKNGVFLTDIKMEKVVSEMNNITVYVVKYEDINGKQSTMRFQMPTVNKDGKILIDGVQQVLKKQRVNLPIVKISDTEISLASNQNKTRVERNTNKAHNFFSVVNSLFTKGISSATIEYGKSLVNLPISYEYVALGERYKAVKFDHWEFYFDFITRKEHFSGSDEDLVKMENEYGVYTGSNKTSWLFIDNQNNIRGIKKSGGEDTDLGTVHYLDLFKLSLLEGKTFTKSLTEWVSIKILDVHLPVIFVLAYRFGLRHILDYLGAKYTITERKGLVIVGESGSNQMDMVEGSERKYKPQPNDIRIKFADRYLWFNRYPLAHSLVLAGLDSYDLSDYDMADFESPDRYYSLMADKGLTINYLKGIDSFYDLFIDNMTYSVLRMMNEPTTVKDLLIRCAVLLSTTDYRPPSSRQNHRIRGFEQFNAILYNEMARQMAVYQSRRGKNNAFNVNPQAVFLRIIQNASMVPSENPNPLQDLKESAYMTYSGVGGRTSDSFVVNDRKFATDDVGVISEATVDNQKVGINAQLTMDPGITNTMGVLEPKTVDQLEPSNVLSAHALVFPYSTNDDAKRINFISTQSSHMIPTTTVDRARIRTGYERVVAHRSSRIFAGIASQDGKVTAVDKKTSTVEVTYADGSIDMFQYGEQYSEFQGFHVTQDILVSVEEGQVVKRGDVITYNAGYFTQDKATKQLDFSIGVHANVALMECDTTLEDSTEISKRLSEKLSIKPTNTRIVVLPKRSVIHSIAKIGQHVLNTDKIVIFEEENLEGSVFNTDEDTLALLGELGKTAPSAKHNGEIVKIEAYYGCEISDMHPTLASVVKSAVEVKNRRSRMASRTTVAEDFPPSGMCPSGSKYRGVTFDDDTVCLVFFIQETMKHDKGDKLVFMNQLKCTCAGIFPQEVSSESGVPIDALFSCNAISARIVLSMSIYGINSRCMEKIEDTAVQMYFGDSETAGNAGFDISDEGEPGLAFFEPTVKETKTYVTITRFPVIWFMNKLKQQYETTKISHLLSSISMRIRNKATVTVHKFFIPELVYLIRKFKGSKELVDEIVNHTWYKSMETEPDKNRVDMNRLKKELTSTPFAWQKDFIETYDITKQKANLRGGLLSLDVGLGKTFTSLALMRSMSIETVVIICPKSLIDSVWVSSIAEFMHRDKTTHVVGQGTPQKADFYVVNYESMDKLSTILPFVKNKQVGIIVDESHNFLRDKSDRTKKLLHWRDQLNTSDILLMSGTPVKAMGVEIIPLLRIIDGYFDDEAATIFKQAFGLNTVLGTDILHSRLGMMMFRRLKEDVFTLPEKHEEDLKVKIPNGNDYTVSNVTKTLQKYSAERAEYHAKNWDRYVYNWNMCIDFLDKSSIGMTPDYIEYKATVEYLRKNGYNRANPELVARAEKANLYEKNTILKVLTPSLAKDFKECKTAIKYLPMKIQGEVLGYLTTLRSQMTTAMTEALDLKDLIDSAAKKTIFFTSYVDVLEDLLLKMRKMGYNPALAYGKVNDLPDQIRKFKTDPDVNPLLCTIQTLATGVTLTEASRTIFMNRPWRQTDYKQASERIYRIGQDTEVEILTVTLDTGNVPNLSTRMQDILQWSKEMSDAIVDGETMTKFIAKFS